MLTAIMLLIAGCLLAPGATLVAMSKSGPQDTIGGMMLMLGTIAAIIAGLAWWAGL